MTVPATAAGTPDAALSRFVTVETASLLQKTYFSLVTSVRR
jgi:hypothetical protein